jgi:hypothetical protein
VQWVITAAETVYVEPVAWVQLTIASFLVGIETDANDAMFPSLVSK